MKKWIVCLLFLSSFSISSIQSASSAVFIQEDGQLVAQENILDEPAKELIESPVSYQTSLSKILWLTVAFIVMIVITFWAFKRIMRNRSFMAEQRASIKILEKKVLSPKTMLYLVEVDKEKVLISESHLEVKRLHNPTSKTPEISEV